MSNKFEIVSKLGEGQFGAVFLGKKRHCDEYVALKVEYNDSPYKMIKHEVKMLHYLYENGCQNIPSIFWFGQYETHLCMAMSYYDCSFEEYIQTDSIQQNSKSSEDYFIKMIEIMEHIHDKYVIHCDVKPANFMIRGDELYLIDFGLSKIYIDENHKHIQNTKHDDTIIGTPKYVSINIHQGCSPARRDDLISCAYIYLYSKMKTVPWENIPDSNEQKDDFPSNHLKYYKNQERMTLKQDMNVILSEHNLGIILTQMYLLTFEQRPNYRFYMDHSLSKS